ncbi:MAG: hypothetical protein CFE44_07655 [Burkholderiales bacterium PBB4]|nr:MAG: hypothetical protein CFE44_07655 [Burkholderiales bacterium PBB4]
MNSKVALLAALAAVALPVATRAEAPAASPPASVSAAPVAYPERVELPEFHGEFTEEAKANMAHFKANYHGDDADPAVKTCLSKGMPWSALIRARDYPVEVYQTDDRIIMMFELYDQFRNIRIDGAPMPENYPESPNGYSVAHWEGDTLVIETTGMPALNPIGPNLRGNGAKVPARWSFKQAPQFGQLFVIDLVQDDPEVYAKPASGHNEMKRAAADVVVGGYNCSAGLWDDFVARKEAMIAKQKPTKP